jgi:uncharacterized protein (TIGR00255 family)
MALLSMTGYGRSVRDDGVARMAAEVRTVNNRSLKLVTRLSDRISSAAHLLEEHLRSRIGRGSVVATVVYRPHEEAWEPRINKEALGKLWSQLDEVRRAVGAGGEAPRIDGLVGVPGMVEDRAPLLGEEPEEAWAKIEPAVSEALTSCLEMRAREGEGLEKDLRERLENVRKSVVAARARSSDAVREYGERFRGRVQAVLGAAGVEVSQAELLRELAFYAERSDVSEEMQRLESHVDQFAKALAGKGPVGRKLEFVAQEMLREGNTMGSKCHDSPSSGLIVDLKLEIDRIREQVLNVE